MLSPLPMKCLLFVFPQGECAYHLSVVNFSSVSDPHASTLMLLKLDFVRIVSSHEHFVALNLPYGPSTFNSVQPAALSVISSPGFRHFFSI